MGLVNVDVDSGKVETIELGAPIRCILRLFLRIASGYAVMNQLIAVDLERKRILKTVDLERTRDAANISRDGKRLFVSGASR